MNITITEQDFKDLMDAKRKYEVVKDKISNRINQFREARSDESLTANELLTMTLFIEILQELLA
jgi:hypothetical protein